MLRTVHLADANNNLGISLVQVQFKEKNIFISPYSIGVALSMLAAGASGTSLAQLSSCLSWNTIDESERLILQTYNQIIQRLNKLNCVELITANSVWCGQEFLSSYIKTLKVHFKAEAHKLVSANEINQWVATKTQDMIPKILESLDPETFGVLVNCIYFKGDWSYSFPVGNTRPKIFKGVDKEREVPMMHMKSALRCSVNDSYSAVELFYQGNQLSFVAVLPHDQPIDEFVRDLSVESLNNIVGGLRTQPEVMLYLPKFTLEYGVVELRETLAALGVTQIYDPVMAQLTRMTEEPAYVSAVLHKAVCIVNEQGTQAAAATAVLGRGGRAKVVTHNRTTITFDKPFIFFIRDCSAGREGLILFVGVYCSPIE